MRWSQTGDPLATRYRAKGDGEIDDRGYHRTTIGGVRRYDHQRVAEQTLQRPLETGEIVHHLDENKGNNDPDNLEVMTKAEHVLLHMPDFIR